MDPRATPSALHDDLVATVRRVETLDLRRFEGEPAPAVLDALRPPIVEALRAAIETMQAVLRRYDGPGPSGPASEPLPDGGREFDHGVDAIVSQFPSEGRVADLGFMALIELRQRLARVEALVPSDEPWHALSVLDSARRRIRKSIGAVATVLCQLEGLAPALGHASELATSLEVRRVYARLRRSIDATREPSQAELGARLRGIGTQIAILIGRPIYPDLRLDDRAQLRRLQARILAWLRLPPDTEESFVVGRRLWTDLAGYARVIALVSHRQELLEHDAHVVAIAAGACRSTSRAELPDRLFERLLSLHGVDDEVDELLGGCVLAVERWRGPLARLERRLARSLTSDEATVSGELEALERP
ncbi:MAG: hypothetical protein KF729_13215 [Sandaracinaceae bacterium]|nr:hypothetical protein [Sandaracinaceae bacterium]